jgi:hypothetical protein
LIAVRRYRPVKGGDKKPASFKIIYLCYVFDFAPWIRFYRENLDD